MVYDQITMFLESTQLHSVGIIESYKRMKISRIPMFIIDNWVLWEYISYLEISTDLLFVCLYCIAASVHRYEYDSNGYITYVH